MAIYYQSYNYPHSRTNIYNNVTYKLRIDVIESYSVRGEKKGHFVKVNVDTKSIEVLPVILGSKPDHGYVR